MARALLETLRLRLEPIREEHASAMFAGLCDDRLYRFIPDVAPASIEALQARYARLQSGLSPDGKERWLNWIVLQLSNAEATGYIQATIRKEEPSNIAFVVFANCWRRGYAYEATTAVITHIFQRYEPTVLVAHVDTRNTASNGLVTKLGFRLVRTVASADPFEARSSDENIYELPRQTWRRSITGDPEADAG